MDEKELILDALEKFARQRPGMDFGNYGDVSRYRAELRGITRALHDARLLLAAVARSSITADDLIKASEGAFSGRLSIKVEGDKITIGYCTGQYWCTEYRNAVCAVLASALWTYKRDHCMPEGALVHNQETGEMLRRYDGLRAGDWLRRRFAREFGRGVASRWFN